MCFLYTLEKIKQNESFKYILNQYDRQTHLNMLRLREHAVQSPKGLGAAIWYHRMDT